MAKEWVKLTVRISPEVYAALTVVCKKRRTETLRALINRFVKAKCKEYNAGVTIPDEDDLEVL